MIGEILRKLDFYKERLSVWAVNEIPNLELNIKKIKFGNDASLNKSNVNLLVFMFTILTKIIFLIHSVST